MADTVVLSRTEYDSLCQAEDQYKLRYEAAAAEMRRKVNQAHEQLAATTRDVERMQDAIVQSYIAARRVRDGYEGDISVAVEGTVSIIERELSLAVPSVKGAWADWTKRHPLEGEDD